MKQVEDRYGIQMAHEITEITMIYVFNSRADVDEEAITEVLPEGGEIMETLAKRLIEKGEARGEVTLLMRLITKKFPELDNKYYDSTAKTIFSTDFPINRLCSFSTGGHTGPPLHQCLKDLQAFVGEPPCGLPQLRYCLILQLFLGK